MLPADPATYWTAIGALAQAAGSIGTFVAVVVALMGYWLTNNQRNADLKQVKRRAADRVLVKLLTITNSIYVMNKHVSGQSAAAPLAGVGGDAIWRRVQPMIGFGDEATIQFDADEAAIFIDNKNADFLMDLLLLGRRHAALISSLQEYSLRRDALNKLTPAPVAFNGMIGTVELTPAEYQRIKPYEIQVEGLKDYYCPMC